MVKKMLKKLIEINALPKPQNKITVCWPDITEPSFSDKVATSKDMMATNELSVKAQQDPVYSTEYIQEYVGVEVEQIEREPVEGEELPKKIIE
jgi:hypothetical protein